MAARYEFRWNDWNVVDKDQTRRFLQVVYTIDPDGTLYVIHAMP